MVNHIAASQPRSNFPFCPPPVYFNAIATGSYALCPHCLIGLGRSCDEEDEVELFHMVVMAGVEQTH